MKKQPLFSTEYYILRLQHNPKKKWVRRFYSVNKKHLEQVGQILFDQNFRSFIHQAVFDSPPQGLRDALESQDYDFSRIYENRQNRKDKNYETN